MRFSQFCEQAEGTEQEQQLLQFFKQDGMKEAEAVFLKMARIPFIGKLFAALAALGDYDSIAEFRQSEHYQNLKDWNFSVNFKKKSLYITLNDEQKKKAMKILAISSAVITLVVLCRKLCCRKK